LTLAAYFVVLDRNRSIDKAIGITMISAAAFWLATWSTILSWALYLRVSGARPDGQLPSVVLFIGGGVGAFVMSTTTFFLYCPTRESTWRKIFVCTVGGGILGVVGYQLGNVPPFGTLPLNQLQQPPPLILYVLWQTGLGLLMGLVWPGTSEQVATLPQPRAAPAPLALKVFMIAVVAPLAWTIANYIRTEYQTKQANAAFAEYRARRPSVSGLPPIAPQSHDLVLVHAPIAGRLPVSPGSHVERAQFDRPEIAEYSICYVKQGVDHCDATIPDVRVSVTQYPTPEWAAYAVWGVSTVNGMINGLGREETITKFGQRILRQPLVDGVMSDVYWVSSVYVVRVMSNIPDADEFVRVYLERHPSSL
jgi:hypothetical protein